MEQVTTASPEAPQLQRSLKLWHLIVYGIIIIQPTAPMGIYGVVSNLAHGHVVTTIAIAMVAMLFTAISYGRMARVYPRAGSAFTYVSEEFNPKAGYIVGWAMLMDYVLNPIICVIWCSQAARNIVPGVPYGFWAIAFVLLITFLNTRGIHTSSRVNAILSIVMSLVVALFLGEGVRYIISTVHPTAADLVRPFYDHATFSTTTVFQGTSVAVLTYIGFDGISTMAEEVENPRRNILLATVLTCLIIGILSMVQVYVAQLAWPADAPFPAVDGGHGIRACSCTCRWNIPLSASQCDAAGREPRLCNCGAVRCVPTPLQHGQRPISASPYLRYRRTQKTYPSQQRFDRRIRRIGRGPSAHVRARR